MRNTRYMAMGWKMIPCVLRGIRPLSPTPSRPSRLTRIRTRTRIRGPRTSTRCLNLSVEIHLARLTRRIITRPASPRRSSPIRSRRWSLLRPLVRDMPPPITMACTRSNRAVCLGVIKAWTVPQLPDLDTRRKSSPHRLLQDREEHKAQGLPCPCQIPKKSSSFRYPSCHLKQQWRDLLLLMWTLSE